MEIYKEFRAVTIEEAIAEACSFFGVERDNVEIEIISEGKSGIFGLVGTRKAVIRAVKKAQTAEAASRAGQKPETAEVERTALDILDQLIKPIADEPSFSVSWPMDGHLKIDIESRGDVGLLIGRDGQTLSALQYLANRILAKRCSGPVKVELDTAAYRQQRDERLRAMALHLAEKVKSEGKPQSTPPLNSGHRRIVHMALDKDDGIRTRSKGDGDLKRVLIIPAARHESRPDGTL